MKAVILCTKRERSLFPVNELTIDSMLRYSGNTAAKLALNEVSAVTHNVSALSDFLAKRQNEYFKSISGGEMNVEFIEMKGELCRYLFELADDEGLLVIEAGCYDGLKLDGMMKFYNAMEKKQNVSCVICAVRADEGIRGAKIRCEDGMAVSFEADEFSRADGYEGIFAGAAFISKEMLERFKDSLHTGIRSLIAEEINSDGSAAVYFTPGRSFDILTPAEYKNACLKMLEAGRVHEKAFEISKGVYCRENISLSGITLIPPVYIGEGARLEKGCIVENCVIEDNAVIGARAELRGCIIGESAVIGASARAAGAVICSGASIKASAQLCTDCVIGERAEVGNGSQVSEGVVIAAERSCAAGEIITEDIISSSNGTPAALDDDCSCGFSNGVSSPAECAAFACAVGACFKAGTIAVCGAGGGTGASSLLASFVSGLSSSGITALSVGDCTAQEVMFLVNRLGAQIGCYIGAEFSERIQLMGLGGLPLDEKKQAEIERACALKRVRKLPLSAFARSYDMREAVSLYRIFLSQLLPEVLKGVNADVRCSSEAIRRTADEIIRPKNDIDGERIVFHISNDGRTCTAYTDQTGYLSNERLILLAVKACFEKDIPVSLPFTYPMAADKLAESMGGKLYRYYHSCPDQSDSAARKVASRPDNFFVRDGAVLMCVICEYLSRNGLSLYEAVEDMPEFYSAQRFAVTSGSADEVYRALGCRRESPNEGIVVCHGSTRAMVRPLKHSKGIMIFTESVKAEIASALCDEIIEKLKKL